MKSKWCNFSDSTYKLKGLVFAPNTGYLGFFYETIGQVQTQEETRRGSRQNKDNYTYRS